MAGGGPVLPATRYSVDRDRGDVSPLPFFTLLALTLPWWGVQFSWSAEFATQLSYMQSMGLSNSQSYLTWALGPLSGFLVQPIVGVFSDRCESKLGRRRPFLLGGLLATVLMQQLYAFALPIGELLGDSGCTRPVGITLAIVAFGFMDCSLNVLQTPLRTIIADVAHREQQELGQSMVSLFTAMGAFTGFAFGFLVKDVVKHIVLYFGIASALLTVTILVACVSAPEKPLPHDSSRDGESACASVCGAFRQIGAGLCGMPKEMMAICFVQFSTWAVWFTFMPVWADWMGVDIFGGSIGGSHGHSSKHCTVQGGNAAYTQGSSLGGLGNGLAAVVQLLFSMVLPRLSMRFGTKAVYLASFAVFTASFMGMAFLPSVKTFPQAGTVAVALIALTGIPMAATTVFPFSIIGRLFPDSPNLALYMGSLNVFIVLPQLLDTMVPQLLRAFLPHFSWSNILLVGAGWSVLAFIAVARLRDGEEALSRSSTAYKELAT